MVFASSCTHFNADRSAERNNRIPQAKPVADYFLAIRDCSLDGFKETFSKMAVFPPDRVIWEYFEAYSQVWKDEDYLFDQEVYNYSYEGGRSKGTVTLHNTVDDWSIAFTVVKEGGDWKLSASTQTAKKIREKGPIPQAKPLIRFIQSVKFDNIDELKDAYTEGYKFPLSDEETLNEMKHMRFNLQTRYGFLFDPVIFDYTYEGSESKGRVIWTLPNGEQESFRVVRENDEWKLD